MLLAVVMDKFKFNQHRSWDDGLLKSEDDKYPKIWDLNRVYFVKYGLIMMYNIISKQFSCLTRLILWKLAAF